jgi:hypothetical protein
MSKEFNEVTIKAEAEIHFKSKTEIRTEPEEKIIYRGFVEGCLDLGNDPENPDPKILDALEGFRVLSDYSFSYTILSKTNGFIGWYAHVQFNSIEEFKEISYVRDLSLFSALAFEDWPDYALNADGQRSHVFMGIQDTNETK